MSDKTSIVVNNQPHEIEARTLNLLFHRNNIKLNIPEAVEITPQSTVAYMQSGISQGTWLLVSKSYSFLDLFTTVFNKESHTEVDLPESLEDLLKMDLGVIHVCGLIFQAMEAILSGNKKIFFRLPETYLHPAAQAGLGDLLLRLSGLGKEKPDGPCNTKEAPGQEGPG